VRPASSLDAQTKARVVEDDYFSVADTLRRVAMGHDAHVIPSRFVHVKRCETPIAAEQIAAALFW
jgi:hypothetical protein